MIACGDGFGARRGIHSIRAQEQQEGGTCGDQQKCSCQGFSCAAEGEMANGEKTEKNSVRGGRQNLSVA